MSLVTITILLALGVTPDYGELDSLLAVQRERAGVFAEELFSVLDSDDLCPEEREDSRFLLAYMPLSDLAMIDEQALLENVRLAREVCARFEWGEQVNGDLYRHFVLPHRISQEPFVSGWREQFLEELTPRVEGLSMTDAALEVNHWCHEVATYVQTSARDQDPLTTIRSGFGRCEEEMILTIAALRSVGIPARQCATPYWPHTDSNHAWVEVWTDGEWHYFGACEPEPLINSAGLARSAGRAMLVVSTAYGDYRGDEPILKRYDRSTLINSTPVYGRTRELEVALLDHRGRPIPNHRIISNLFNLGCLRPALGLNTDSDGLCRVTCGLGDWTVSGGAGKYSAYVHSKAMTSGLSCN